MCTNVVFLLIYCYSDGKAVHWTVACRSAIGPWAHVPEHACLDSIECACLTETLRLSSKKVHTTQEKLMFSQLVSPFVRASNSIWIDGEYFKLI